MNPHVREATEYGRLPMSMHSLDTSVSLLQRLAGDQQDANAWQEFVTRYGGLVLHWARRWGLSGSDAQDVAQEVLLVLVRQIRSFRYDPQRRFRSWLKTIVMRTCTRLRQAELRSEVNGKGGTLHARLLESIEARENLAHLLERFADREVLELAVQRVKRRVQPTTWAAFERLAIERRPGLVVARELGLKLSWIYVARHKVQRMLREELDKLEEA